MSNKLNYEKLRKRDLVIMKGSDPFKSNKNKLMQSLFVSRCLSCGEQIRPGDWIHFYFETKYVKHQHCKYSPDLPDFEIKKSVRERSDRTRAKRGKE